MTGRQKIFGVMGALLLTTVSGTAWAATYYVATNGSDSAAGTEAAPWKTVKYAVSRMNAGDTTYVRGGTYKEDMIWFRKSGTASAPIRLLNAPGESPKISFNNPWNDRVLISAGSGMGSNLSIGWIHVEGFEITNGMVGIQTNNVHDAVFRRNWIHHTNFVGINGNGKNILVDRNVINRNGDFAGCAVGKPHAPDRGGVGTVCTHDHGMYPTGMNWTITNNLIYDNLAFGIHVAGYEYNPEKHTDPSFAGASGWLIANNTIAYNNHRAGIVLWKPGTTNNRIINNILYENGQVGGGTNGIAFLNSGGGNFIQNNICYATAPGSTKCIDSSAGAGKYTESGNIVNTANPNFEGAGATISGVPNFKLRAGSPAIDKGQSLSQVTWDHQGIKRPAGAAFDIGAYEFCPPGVVCEQGSPPPNPTGDGGSFTPGAPVFLSPTGEICPSPYLPLR